MTDSGGDMLFSYGEGEFVERGRCFRGRIVLGSHKLYLRGVQGDLPQTYIPLEKILELRRRWSGLCVLVRPSPVSQYEVMIRGQRKLLAGLALDLVSRRGLKKKSLFAHWWDPGFL